ncbi:MAG: hypothetical protein JO352_13660 [Chloroflexi bacterium]|nr:hypothetical protein [Chloroflexota bacterium]MBV9597238.1 hypothetical protein [Chloroflexota bacterium]
MDQIEDGGSQAEATGILPANITDPRFANSAYPERPDEQPWNMANALGLEATDSLDELGEAARSAVGASFLDLVVSLALDLVGQLLGQLAGYLSR